MRPDCPTCGAHGVDVWDGNFAPHGGPHTPNKVPYPCPMTGQPIPEGNDPSTDPVQPVNRQMVLGVSS